METRDLPEHLASKVAIKEDDSTNMKFLNHDQTDRPTKKVEKTRSIQSKQKKYKATRITTKLKVTGCRKSTNSRVLDYNRGKKYLQATFIDLETVVLENNDVLYGDAYND